MTHRPPTPTLFPYTTLFRSNDEQFLSIDQMGFGTQHYSENVRAFAKLRALKAIKQVRGITVNTVHGNLHRSEEHTSELQSRPHLVCRLLLEKKKYINIRNRK